VGAGTEITDLGGKTVLPGLIEGHMHVSNLGENHLKLDCYFKSKEDILEMVRQAAKEAEPGEWIQGSGWLDTLWDESKRLINPHTVHVDLSNELWHTKNQLLDSFHRK
jgi:predicted amidohydrolase YtcJ